MSDNKRILTPRLVLILLIFIVGVPMLPLLISWQWDWWEAWAYVIVNILSFVASRYLASRKNPDLMVERGRFMEHNNTEPWDKRLSPLLGIGSALIPLTVGLDTLFGRPVHFVLWVRLLALALMIAGYFLGSYALVANRYFSGMVRIQADREHQVVTARPYRWIRHPGYAGALLSYLATPFLLQSLWSIIPVLMTLGILVVRTVLEDRTLQEKLEGYCKYAQEVQYRLLPGIW
jgi:protein-S-isoprenylcysteine O-methyltransferase Ste14